MFSQNCCDECFKHCKKILCKKNDNNSDLDDNSDFDNNLDLNNKNDNSNLNNNLDLDDNSDLDNNQEQYFKSLLDNFDKNIKIFNYYKIPQIYTRVHRIIGKGNCNPPQYS